MPLALLNFMNVNDRSVSRKSALQIIKVYLWKKALATGTRYLTSKKL